MGIDIALGSLRANVPKYAYFSRSRVSEARPAAVRRGNGGAQGNLSRERVGPNGAHEGKEEYVPVLMWLWVQTGQSYVKRVLLGGNRKRRPLCRCGAARKTRRPTPLRGKETQGKTPPDAREPLERRPNAPWAAGPANRAASPVSVGPVDQSAQSRPVTAGLVHAGRYVSGVKGIGIV